MPSFLEREEDDDIPEPDDVVSVYGRPAGNPDYFSAYKHKPYPINPANKLSDFSTGTPRFKSPDELEGRIRDYFDTALKRGQPLTISGMANAIGTNRKQLLDYQEWYKEAEGRDETLMWLHVKRIITAALSICEQFAEEKLFDGKMKPNGTIFQMVNNFGWRNKLDVEGSSNSEELSEIRSAYQALLSKNNLKTGELGEGSGEGQEKSPAR